MGFRKALLEDIPAIAAIYDAIHTAQEVGLITTGWIRNVYPTVETAEAAVKAGDLFVMVEDGSIVASGRINFQQMEAYGQADWHYPADRVCVLHTLTVAPSAFGRGYGSQFVAFYEEYALSHGCCTLRMDTNARNARARKLYSALGYREADIVPCTFNGIPGVELLCLEKRLVEVWQIAAFTHQGAGGNMAGVVLDSSGLTATDKQTIAAEMGYSETVFLSPSNQADYRLEYFTPAAQVPLCGHATIAALALLHSRGMTGVGTIDTLSGILKIRIEPDGTVFMEQNLPEYGQILSQKDLATCVDPESISDFLPIRVVSTGLRDILLPVKSPQALSRLNPVFPEIAELSRRQNTVGVHAYALTDTGPAIAVCRNFAPLYGIPEESATGTSNCALACWLFHNGIRREEYIFDQGITMGLPSRIFVRLDSAGNTLLRIWVGGKATLKAHRIFHFASDMIRDPHWVPKSV